MAEPSYLRRPQDLRSHGSDDSVLARMWAESPRRSAAEADDRELKKKDEMMLTLHRDRVVKKSSYATLRLP
jgi:hypothetical protein